LNNCLKKYDNEIKKIFLTKTGFELKNKKWRFAVNINNEAP
jgi:hypothetical protein